MCPPHRPSLKLIAVLLLGLSASQLIQAQPSEFLLEYDKFRVVLPEQLYPVVLNYTQDNAFGRVSVKNLSFHSNIGKFVIQLVDFPATDQRSAKQRIEAIIFQLSQNPSIQLSEIKDLSNNILVGAKFIFVDRDLPGLQAIFVDGHREYHLTAESFEPENRSKVLRQLDGIIESFQLATANAAN